MTDTATETELLETIQSAESVDSADEARTAVEATLETLGERIGDGQADDLAATLPTVAADPLQSVSPGEAESFTLPVFLERVGERSGIDADPLELARAAVAGLRETADETEFERTREQLPAEYDLVFDPGEQLTEDEFLAIVADELPDGVDVDPHEATDAVLETLGQRITGGQAGDLATYVPREIRSPLTDVDESAPALGPEAFLEHVATRAAVDVDADDARDVTRAVASAIRESAANAEFENVRSQLPAAYDPLFGDQ